MEHALQGVSLTELNRAATLVHYADVIYICVGVRGGKSWRKEETVDLNVPPLDFIPLSSCALPSQVTISDAAWRVVQTSSASFANDNAESQRHVIGFFWSTGGTLQRSPHDPIETLPSGLGLGFYRRDQIPRQAFHSRDGMDCVVVIPADVLEGASEKTVDVDDQIWRGFVLREVRPSAF